MSRSRRPKPSATAARSREKSASAELSRWLSIAFSAAVLVALAAWWLRPRPQGPIILISIDTLRADHLPAYGYTRGRTPVIDALAREGVVFEHAYAHAPQTLPSHTSILTGELPFEHGVRDNLGFTLKPGAATMATLFKSAGYTTGGFVSSYVLRKATGLSAGFDVYDDAAPAGSQERSIGQIQRPGDETTAAATRWLASLTNDKFFLFLHLYEPHAPYTPPQRYADLLPYDGEIAYADEIVGTLITTLKQRGWYDHATIALISDHGEGLNEHGEEEHGLFLYNSTIHVPIVIKLPESEAAGKRISAPVQHVDLLPTLMSEARIKIPVLSGRNLLPAMTGGKSLDPRGIYAEAMYARYHFGWSELQSLTDERYRFIKAPNAELYDLPQDSGERTNILSVHSQIAQAMNGGLANLVAGHGIDAPGNVSSEDRQALASLGYIGGSSAALTADASTLPDPKSKIEVLRAYRAAVDALGQGRLLEGISGLRAIVATEPGMADVWNQLGTALARVGNNEDAFKAFQKVIELDPNEPIALIDAAQMLMKLGRFGEARQHAEIAVQAQPVMAHEMLAKIALAAKMPDEALAQARLAEQADPNYPLPEYIAGILAHEKGDYAAALPHFTNAYARVKDRTMQMNDLRYYIADSLARLNHLPEAEKFFQEEVSLYPYNTRARLGLAMLYEATGRAHDTDTTIATALRAVPTPDTYQQVAKLWRLFGQPARAAAIEAEARARFGPGR